MRGIKLIDTIKLFGFKDAIPFWFDWSFVHPIQRFIFLNITHKPYCLECGWYCGKFNKNCNGKKLTRKQDILNHWKEIEKEIRTIEKGKDESCVYCGEEKGTETIPNPNLYKLSQWLVCKDCKETIHYQHQLSISQLTGNEKGASEAIDNIDRIARRTGKTSMSATIFKKPDGSYDSASIEFRGDTNGRQEDKAEGRE